LEKLFEGSPCTFARDTMQPNNQLRETMKPIDTVKLDKIVANARKDSEMRSKGYRERALKMYPWICGRCAREFTRTNVIELTVHHKNHNHDDNPNDGSNWELLCVYCHDNEHSRYIDQNDMDLGGGAEKPATSNPFANLAAMMGSKK
jgi:5-methylcytosine-specific restriction endonuclease McrA